MYKYVWQISSGAELKAVKINKLLFLVMLLKSMLKFFRNMSLCHDY